MQGRKVTHREKCLDTSCWRKTTCFFLHCIYCWNTLDTLWTYHLLVVIWNKHNFSNFIFVFPKSLCWSTIQATFVKCISTSIFIRMKKEHVEYFANIVWANDELSAVSASQNNIMNNAEAYLDWLLREYW